MRMKAVLDLWSGTGSATQPWEDDGYIVITVDQDQKRKPTFCMDILEFREFVLNGKFDGWLELNELELCFIWASPDCKVFSIANCGLGHSWHHGNPISSRAFLALARVAATLEIIDHLDVDYWVLENPRAMLRTIPMMGLYPRRTVTYCQYGDTRMKPTDLWGFIPVAWKPKICQNGDSCHTPSPRGSRTSTQAMNYDDKIRIPYELPNSIKRECEKREYKRERWMDLSDYPTESLEGGVKRA